MSDNKNNSGKKPDPKIPQNLNRLLLIGIILFAVMLIFIYSSSDPLNQRKTINYSEFLLFLENDRLIQNEPLIFTENRKIRGKYNDRGTTVSFETNVPQLWDDGALYKLLTEKNIPIKAEGEKSPFFQLFLFNVLPILILVLMIWFMFRQFQGSGNKAFTFGKSRARKFESKEKITFKNVARATDS